MGEVWLAEQTEPVKRKVALKVIKAGDAGCLDEGIAEDSGFASLRGDPEFEAIVAEVKKRIGEK